MIIAFPAWDQRTGIWPYNYWPKISTTVGITMKNLKVSAPHIDNVAILKSKIEGVTLNSPRIINIKLN